MNPSFPLRSHYVQPVVLVALADANGATRANSLQGCLEMSCLRRKLIVSLERSLDPARERSIKEPTDRRFDNGSMVEAIHIYKRDKDSTLKIISKYTQITRPDPCILSSSQNLVYFMVGNEWGKTYGHKY